jgi:hypothetical protein
MKVEQLPSHTRPSWRKTRRFFKKMKSRTLRRLGKTKLEDAPKSVMQGYCD